MSAVGCSVALAARGASDPARHPVQLLVHQRDQRIERGAIPLAQSLSSWVTWPGGGSGISEFGCARGS
jgi:hypothetical protein